jgi:hypothetical protein
LYTTEKTYKSLLLELKLKTNIIIFFFKKLTIFNINSISDKTVSKPNDTLSTYLNASLNKVIAEFNIISNNFNPSSFNLSPNDFKKFIIGLFQAEGTITAYFKKSNSLRLGFYFAIGKNFTPALPEGQGS